MFQRKQCPQALVESSCMATQFVVFLTQSLNGNTDTNIRKLLCQCYNPIFKPARGGDYNSWGMLVALLNYLGQVFADEWLSARKVDELQLRQRLEVFRLYLLLPVCRVLPDVAHLAAHRAAIRQDDACVGWTRNVCVSHFILFL